MPEIIFTLYQRSDKEKWYAQGQVDGARCSVYIGKTQDAALDKINSWLEKKGIENKATIKQFVDVKENFVAYERQIAEQKKVIAEKDEQIKLLEKIIAEKDKQIQRTNATHLATKPAKPTAKPVKSKADTTEKTDWDALREKLKQKARQRGGNQPLARAIGVSESIIRRFVKGESQKLSPENLAKVKQAVK